MRRRDFLAASAAATIGIAARSLARAEDAPNQSSSTAIAKGAKLSRPANAPINVAFAISKGTTNIDWIGPEAVFQTWHFDPVAKKHAPRFKLHTVSDNLEPASHIVP